MSHMYRYSFSMHLMITWKTIPYYATGVVSEDQNHQICQRNTTALLMCVYLKGESVAHTGQE